MSSPSNPFLFVNETSKSPTYKVGYRPDVRSHIRKHVARGLNKRKLSHSHGNEHGEQQVHLSISPSFAEPPGFVSPSEVAVGGVGNSSAGLSRTVFCKVCGSFVDYKGVGVGSCVVDGEKKVVPRRDDREMWRALLRFSPCEVLGSGRVDPFLSSAEMLDEATSELMDLAVTYLIPGLMPDDHPDRSLSLTSASSRTWVSAALSLPFLFNAMLLACSLERDFLLHSSSSSPKKSHIITPYNLTKKVLAIQKLNAFISDPENAARDEVLLAILILAAHEELGDGEEERRPFNAPLRNMQWLNMYGNCRYDEMHMKALREIVDARGGLETIKLPCMAEMIVLGDIISALNTFSKPTFAPIPVHEAYITSALEWAKMSPHLPAQVIATSFPQYSVYGISEPLLEILEALGITTWAISYHLQGKPAGLTIGEIGRTRAAVLQRLLFLPSAEELAINTDAMNDEAAEILEGRPNLYECCRLTAFIYSVAVTFPIPHTFAVLQHYVQLLKIAIEDEDVMRYLEGDDVLAEIMLWILMLGGVAALDKPEREWFVEHLAKVRMRLGVSWEEAMRVFETFLWLGSACSDGGRMVWKESEAFLSTE